jgi:hypothetical protein
MNDAIHDKCIRRICLLGAIGIVLWCVCCVWMPASAGANEAKLFGITDFAMEMTAGTEVINEGSGAVCEPCRVVNLPYEPSFTQAGGRPWAMTTRGRFASEELSSHEVVPTRDPKDIVVNLPAGLLGDPQAVPRCPLASLLSGVAFCPTDTQVGVARLRLFGGKQEVGPVVNLTPEAGQSAEFGLENHTKLNYLLTVRLVRTTQGYGIAVVTSSIPLAEIVEFEVTIWGVPADPSHDQMRGMFCATAGDQPSNFRLFCEHGGEPAGIVVVPFLAMPTDCSVGPVTATIRADSWQEPGRVRENQKYEGYSEKETTLPGVTGCNLLKFDPGIEVRPDTLLADEPAGLGVNLQVPQAEKPGAPATPHLRNAVITLPEGMSVSPGVVDGIKACDESGPEGINFTGPESEEVGLSGELQLAPGHCPDASIVGTAEAITPVLSAPVKGHVYLARPGCGGAGQAACTEHDAVDGNLYKLYFELGGNGELANAGIQIKVAGKTEANLATGQLTTVVEENPQTPFSELRVHLNGGPRAPIDNPATCGAAVTTSDFTPWSEPGVTPEGLSMPGTPDATPSSFFDVEGCSSPPPFNPGFLAGMVSPQAAQFSSFTLNLSRKDREQYVKGIQLHTPPGLLGILSNVPLCGEPEANNGTCPATSRIGSTTVASGAGSHPFEVSGNVYLTGPYRGAPFGLSIVTNAVAGPFNLGLVVVRARIAVNRENSTLTVTTDETGSRAVPQIIFGVPLRLQRITVDIDRPNFMFNPTNCSAQRISATISGSQDAVANVSSPFAVGGCKSLAFKPKFTVSTSGRTSRANGASLDTKLSYPAGSMGNDANIARVKVSLPRQLPSRLTTLQKACRAATFDANPAACPAGSVVGIVRASTPLLPVELSGPVYFVSHGGEAFPSLIIVLQGYGVRVDLTGSTFINKAGITSSTFNTVPDVPVGSFELYLPQGKNSALAANGNLCKTRASKLVMPTEMVAQNGAVVKQNTKIAVTGCKAVKARSPQTGKPKRAAGARASRDDTATRRTGR